MGPGRPAQQLALRSLDRYGDDAAGSADQFVQPANPGLAGARTDVPGYRAPAGGEGCSGLGRVVERSADRPLFYILRRDRPGRAWRDRGMAASSGLYWQGPGCAAGGDAEHPGECRFSARSGRCPRFAVACRAASSPGRGSAIRCARSSCLATCWLVLRRTGVLGPRAARRVARDADLRSDAPDLVASLLAGGFDGEAARWARALGDMDDEPADKVWAMLALGAPETRGLGISASRIADFADRDRSDGKQRTALLVAGLAGLGPAHPATAGRLTRTNGLGWGAKTDWTNLIDGAMRRRQAGTSLVLTASALQGGDFDQIRPVYMFHAINALQKTGQGYLARMIAAEGLAR